MLAAPPFPRQPPGPWGPTLSLRWLLPSVCQPSRGRWAVYVYLSSFIYSPCSRRTKAQELWIFIPIHYLYPGGGSEPVAPEEKAAGIPPSGCLCQDSKEQQRGKG